MNKTGSLESQLMDAFKDEVRDRLPKIMGEFTSNEISADTFMLLYEN